MLCLNFIILNLLQHNITYGLNFLLFIHYERSWGFIYIKFSRGSKVAKLTSSRGKFRLAEISKLEQSFVNRIIQRYSTKFRIFESQEHRDYFYLFYNKA